MIDKELYEAVQHAIHSRTLANQATSRQYKAEEDLLQLLGEYDVERSAAINLGLQEIGRQAVEHRASVAVGER